MTMNYVERAVRPIPGDPPRTFIDGVERSTFEVEYTSADDVTKHIVELRLDNTTIRTLQVSLDSFGDRCKSDGQMQSIVQEICVYDSGDLRFGSETVDGACVANAFCRPACQPLEGCATSRCTSLVTSTSPLTSHLGCAPIGTQLLGLPGEFARFNLQLVQQRAIAESNVTPVDLSANAFPRQRFELIYFREFEAALLRAANDCGCEWMFARPFETGGETQ